MAGRYLIDFTAFWILLFSCVTCTTQKDVSIERLHIESIVTHRFSTTHVTSVLVNVAENANEATFDLRLPKSAFISNFSMTIDGEVYPGEIAEKEKAREIYNAAVQAGQSAGYVRASPRQSTKFAVSVNVAAGKNVTFELVYEELLQRRLGLYEHVIYIDPGQLVPDLFVEVYIVESRVITDLSVPQITNDLLTDEIIDDTNEYANINMLSESSAHVTFWPTVEEQERFTSQGVSGQFIINYDVEHDSEQIGEILVSDGYFVHYFAPVWLEPMSKQIMFVMDTSGSMSGVKIVQMKQALVTILNDLSPDDEFGIVTFSSDVNLWNSGETLPASEENIARAKNHANQLNAGGGTNINSALATGISLLETDSRKAAMLIFLTDGEATSGETSSNQILENIRKDNEGVSIFCLGFGQDADFGLLQKISAENNGVARKIYEDADATLQLAGFYDEISSPLLSNLKIRYIGDAVDNNTLTETNLHCLFDGAEMVVAGRLRNDNNTVKNNITVLNTTGLTIDLVIEGDHIDNTLVIESEIYLGDTSIDDIPKLSPESIKSFTKRLWVYLTIKQLIDTSLQSTNPEKANEAKARALELSLKYGFVTPFTSMVVTKPGDDDDDDIREVAGGKPVQSGYPDYSQRLSSGPQASLPSYSYYDSGLQYDLFSYDYDSGPSGTIDSGYLPSTTRPPKRHHTISHRPTSRATTTTTTAPGHQAGLSYDDYDSDSQNSPLSYDYDSDPIGTITTSHRPTYVSPATTKTTTTTTAPSARPTSKPTAKRNYPAAVTIAVDVKHSPVGRVNVCFDIPDSTPIQSSYSLLHSNIDLTGSELASYDGGKKFQTILLKVDNRTVEFSTKGVKFDSSRVVGWWQLKFKNIVDGEVMKDGSLKIYTGQNASVTVNKHGIKSRRSRAEPFLTVRVDIPKQQLKNASGLLGKILARPKPSILKGKVVYGPMRSDVYEYSLGNSESCYRMTSTKTIIQLLNL